MPTSKKPTDSIAFECPACQARLRAARSLIGRNCPCPRCRELIQVRAVVPSDADILLVEEKATK
jgi:hypothetical protein